MRGRLTFLMILVFAVVMRPVTAEDIQARFAEAPHEFSPVPIWWWSGGPVNREQIRDQLERLAAGGLYNAMILNLAPSGPLFGSPADEPEFLSEEWWDLFGYALQEGKRLGVRLWFYDQLGFSGSGLQGRLIKAHPEYRSVELKREVRDGDGPGEVEFNVLDTDEPLALFVAQHEGDPAAKPGPNSLGTPLRAVRRVELKPVAGRVRVQTPAGPWRVEYCALSPGRFDYHNPAAGAALLDVVHGEIERRFGAELGKGIAGSFQDEFPTLPRFSRRMLAEFKARAGYELVDVLPALANDVVDRFGRADGPSTVQIRCDVSRVGAEMCEEAFFKPLYEWHERHGLLYGYDQLRRNADPVRCEGHYIDYFKTMRHYSVPGNDQTGDAKPHQSIADLYERPRVWLEAFHSSGWGQTLEEATTLLHPWLAQGSTLYNPHAIYFSTHGSFYEWAPPDTGWRQPYFAHYAEMSRYVSRLCYLLTRGRHVAPVAVLHPARTVHAYRTLEETLPAARRANDIYWAVQDSLRKRGLDYIIIDEDSIARATMKGHTLAVGWAELNVVILPGARVLQAETAKKLAQFAAGGGRIFVTGDATRQLVDSKAAPKETAEWLEKLSAAATGIEKPGNVAKSVEGVTGRDLGEVLPFLHRRGEGRDFYFVLSDTETPATRQASREVATRKLWNTRAACGGRLSLDLRSEGVPELWSAVTGKVTPILNYRRQPGRTRVEVELTETAAPVVAIRPAVANDPLAIESDLEIVSLQREGAAVALRGRPRLDATTQPAAEYTARVEFADGAYAGRAAATALKRIEIPGPLEMRIVPTADNRYGDYAWPPSPGPLPVEVRAFKYHEEQAGEDPAMWKNAEFNDAAWKTVLAGYGPRAVWMGPIKPAAGETFETLKPLAGVAGMVREAEYSLRLGIDEDPISWAALGCKSRIPEAFIDLGVTKPGDVYAVMTTVTVPAAALEGKDSLPAMLRIGGLGTHKRAFLNGQEVQLDPDMRGRVLRGPVTLKPGDNTLLIYVRRPPGSTMTASKGSDRLRLFYHFLPPEGAAPDPQWIWSATHGHAGRTRFTKEFDVSGPARSATMIVALGDLHEIRLNGTLVASQGNYDTYFTVRTDRHDISAFIQPGRNRLEIIARDTGQPTGLLIDGLVTLADGGTVMFVSDASFMSAPLGSEEPAGPATILSAPIPDYHAEAAAFLARPRPHPLPLAGWLEDQPPPPAPFDALVYSTGADRVAAGWYRFRLPPGATSITVPTRLPAELYVDGQRVELKRGEGVYTGALPRPEASRRMAALRITSAPGFVRGAAMDGPLTFEVGPGRMEFGSWDVLGLPHYSGAVYYQAGVTLPDTPGAQWVLDLGHVRGSVEAVVNGQSRGVRLWHPFRFDITPAAKIGANRVELRVHNTLGPHYGMGHPSGYVFGDQTQSGIFGPVGVTAVQPVEMRLEKTPR